jgi:hypothetical protein
VTSKRPRTRSLGSPKNQNLGEVELVDFDHLITKGKLKEGNHVVEFVKAMEFKPVEYVDCDIGTLQM